MQSAQWGYCSNLDCAGSAPMNGTRIAEVAFPLLSFVRTKENRGADSVSGRRCRGEYLRQKAFA